MFVWSLLSEERQRIIVETISLPKLVEHAIVEVEGGVHELGAENKGRYGKEQVSC